MAAKKIKTFSTENSRVLKTIGIIGTASLAAFMIFKYVKWQQVVEKVEIAYDRLEDAFYEWATQQEENTFAGVDL